MLMRYDPFAGFDLLTRPGAAGQQGLLAMDAYRQGDRFLVHFDLPGVDPASVELNVERNVLTVSAQRPATPAGGEEWLVSERPHGAASRQLFLGEGLDLDRIEASYDRGVLTVSVPVAEAAKPRKVEIAAVDAVKALEAPAKAS